MIPGSPRHWARQAIAPHVLGGFWQLWDAQLLPPEMLRCEVDAQAQVLPPEQQHQQLQAKTLQVAADSLRELLHIATSGVARVPLCLQQSALSSIQCLQAAHDERDLALLQFQNQRAAYPIATLLRSLLICTKLRRAGSLHEVLQMSLQAAVHPALSERLFGDTLQGLGGQGGPSPSEATISRHQLTLLAGHILWRQQRNTPTAKPHYIDCDANFLLIDSSPQGASANKLRLDKAQGFSGRRKHFLGSLMCVTHQSERSSCTLAQGLSHEGCW